MTFESQGLSESDLGKDANVLIMELNKGFQSTNLGIQCKTIAQFPSVLEKYPFPVVINSILLKITQIFCDGNNHVRLCILRACAECRTHFKKLTVCEDIIRKLLPFTESNDPTVRALTLRLFGILDEITREHLGVHHAILKQIESHYEVESDAAVWACHTIAPISSVFAGSLCPILCKLLNDLSTDTDTKLKLLHLGKHMHHNSTVSEEIRRCLIEMLNTYNTTNFVSAILDTLTTLETRAPLHVHSQIDLLLKRLSIEKRPQVRQSVLWNLITLAENIPHHFDKPHFLELSSIYHGESCSKLDKVLILQIFFCLTTSFHSMEFLTLSSGQLDTAKCYTPVDCIKSALQDTSSHLLIRAIQLACKLTILKGDGGQLENSDTDCCTDYETSFNFEPKQLIQLLLYHFNLSGNKKEEKGSMEMLWYLHDKDIPISDLKCTYSLLVEFFSTFPSYASQLHKMNFIEGIQLDGATRTGLLCQFLCTMYARLSQYLFLDSSTICNAGGGGGCGDVKSEQLTYSNVLSKLTNSIPGDRVSCSSSSSSTLNSITSSVLSAVGLVFQLTGGIPLTQREQTLLMSAVSKFLGEKVDRASLGYRLSPWFVYQLARQANRYGQHEFACRLYAKLSSLTLTEKSYFWLTGLCEFSQMESNLINLANCLETDVKRTLTQRHSEIGAASSGNTTSWISKLIIGLRNAAEESCRIQTTIICIGGSDGRWFQAKYIQIRSLLLASLSNLCSNVYRALKIERWSGSILMNQPFKSDPIQNEATDFTTYSRDSSSSSQSLVWLSSCIDEWNDLSNEISKLRAQCLDADVETHWHLEAITQVVEFFIEILSLINASSYPSGFSSIEEYLSSGLETNSSHTYTSDPYGKIVSILRTSMRQYFPIDNTPVIREWIPVLIFKVVQVASHWPRFFFQRLQTTTVRLVLLPKAGSNPDDVLTISNDVCHMIQVMGVVQQRSRLDKKALLRRIEAVEIAVNVNEICPESIRNGQYTKLDLIYSTQKATQLKGDYFHSEFCIRFPQSTQVMMHSNSGGILRQSDRIFCIHAHPIIIDSLGSHWDLSANAGATDESVLVRVESLPLATTQPMQAALHLSTTQSQSDSQDPSEVCQSINSGPTTSSTSAAVAPSTATTNTSSSHSINQKSDLTKSKIASRTPDGWKSQTKNRPKKTGSVKFSPYNLK